MSQCCPRRRSSYRQECTNALSNIHMLITDVRATDKAIAPFLERGIEVQRVLI